MTTTELMAMTSEGDTIVVDPNGGIWWPSDEAAADIAAHSDPAARAVEIATNEPMRGEWRQ